MDKLLSNVTLNDVKRAVNAAYHMSHDKGRIYIQLEDEYSDNPRMYLSTRERHPGGGRVTWGYVMQSHDVFAEIFPDSEDEFYSKEEFCQRLYDYIQRKYQ